MAPAAPMARFSVDLSRLAIDFGRVDEAREIIEQALVMARSGGFAPVEGELLEASASAANKEDDKTAECGLLKASLLAFNKALFPDPASVRRPTEASNATC